MATEQQTTSNKKKEWLKNLKRIYKHVQKQ